MTAATSLPPSLILPDLPAEASATDAARAYQAAGFHVVALHGVVGGRCVCGTDCGKNAGKHPCLKGWKTATDGETLTALGRGVRNLGLVMGGPARLVALDVDGPEGAAQLAALEREHGPLPPTPTQRTGSGGEHRLFYCPPHLDMARLSNRVRLRGGSGAGGLDVRAEGGQIAVAPSWHRSGQQYQWTRGGEVAALPDALYWLIAPPGEPPHEPPALAPAPVPSPSGVAFGAGVARPDALERARAYLATMPPAVQGQKGSVALFRAAVTLVHGFALPEATAEALLWSDFNPRCMPPWRRDEPDGPRHKVASVRTARLTREKPRGHLLMAEGERRYPPTSAPASALPPPSAVAPGGVDASVLDSPRVVEWLEGHGIDPAAVDLFGLAWAHGDLLQVPVFNTRGERAGVLTVDPAGRVREVGQQGLLACGVALSMLRGYVFNETGTGTQAPRWAEAGAPALDVTLCSDVVGYLRAAAAVSDGDETPPATLATLGAWPADLAGRLPPGCNVDACAAPDAGLDDLLDLAADGRLFLTVNEDAP